jgi:NAD(P)-dependent dehydrogenase (short-subunit alcohol dehydrogenase family)
MQRRKPQRGSLAISAPLKPVALDVADLASIEKAAAEVASRYGYLDVLVNNAGINYDTWETVKNEDINGTVMPTVTKASNTGNAVCTPWPNSSRFT